MKYLKRLAVVLEVSSTVSDYRIFIMRKLISFCLLGAFATATHSQNPLENWSTLKVKGSLSENIELAIEGEHRYNHDEDYTRYFHTDFGIIYKLSDKFKVGGFLREIYELKSDVRVREVRPHVDLVYKATSNIKVRCRTEYQIKEFSDNKLRIRLRPTYSLKLNEKLTPYIQTEVFFVGTSLVRNRLNPGISISVHENMSIAPGFILESNFKNEVWSHINILWVAATVKF